MKKTLCLVLALGMILVAFAACGAPQESAAASQTATESVAVEESAAPTEEAVESSASGLSVKEGMKIGLSVYDLANPYFVTVVNGAQAKCDELGIELIVDDPKSNAAAQVTAIDNFITMEVDAIIICPLDTAAVESSLQKAQEKGIKIISQSSCSDTRDVWVSADEWDMGHVAGVACGQWLAEKYGADSSPVVAVLGWDQISTQKLRGDGMEDGIKENIANAQIIRQDANTTAQGQSVTDSLLQAYPDLTAIVCLNDAGAIGAFSAVEAAGKNNDDFYIGAIDATQQGLELVAEDNCYRGTVDLIPYENGGIDVELAVQLVNGETVEDPYVIPAKNVNKDNVGEYLGK